MAAPARHGVIGVDFSGARDAGKLIWIAEGEATPDGLALRSCIPARDLPGGAVQRTAALAALVDRLAGAGNAAVGLDFPFSLPVAFVTPPDWAAFAAAFPVRYPDPEAFRDAMRAASPGAEIRRLTDIETKTPFCPWNLRLYRQTWHGIAGVLAPLVARDAARVAPMQPTAAGRPVLIETCPASLLKRLTLYQPAYKGHSAAARARRDGILDALVSRALLQPPAPALRGALVDNAGGDALDAVLAAICAMRGAADPKALEPRNDTDRLEARVYC